MYPLPFPRKRESSLIMSRQRRHFVSLDSHPRSTPYGDMLAWEWYGGGRYPRSIPVQIYPRENGDQIQQNKCV